MAHTDKLTGKKKLLVNVISRRRKKSGNLGEKVGRKQFLESLFVETRRARGKKKGKKFSPKEKSMIINRARKRSNKKLSKLGLVLN